MIDNVLGAGWLALGILFGSFGESNMAITCVAISNIWLATYQIKKEISK